MNRNCGRTGPTSEAGKLRSAQNSFKHGGCSARLILPGESEEEWEELLGRWHKTYEPEPDSLSYDFVQRAAEADWRRLRNERNYDDYLFLRLEGRAPYEWNGDEIKMHDLLLRYKTTAERSFQRDVRALDQHYRVHCPKKLEPKATEKPKASLTIIGVDRNSPTGYSLVREMVEGKEVKSKEGSRQDRPCNCTALQAEACTTSRHECLRHNGEMVEGKGSRQDGPCNCTALQAEACTTSRHECLRHNGEMVEGKESRQDGPCNCTALQAEACTTSRHECLRHNGEMVEEKEVKSDEGQT